MTGAACRGWGAGAACGGLAAAGRWWLGSAARTGIQLLPTHEPTGSVLKFRPSAQRAIPAPALASLNRCFHCRRPTPCPLRPRATAAASPCASSPPRAVPASWPPAHPRRHGGSSCLPGGFLMHLRCCQLPAAATACISHSAYLLLQARLPPSLALLLPLDPAACRCCRWRASRTATPPLRATQRPLATLCAPPSMPWR